jgi:uncharacterized protein
MGSTPYTGFVSPQYIEPTICFTANRLKVSENYPMDKLSITDLVQKDQVLVGFTDTDLPETDKVPRRSLIAGANTFFSEDKKQVLSDIVGYPAISFCPVQESEEQALEVSVAPLFHVSRNKMEASIVIDPLLFNCTTLSSEDLYQLLINSGIVSGIDYNRLKLIKEHIRKGVKDSDQIVLARGKEPIAGSNAYLKFKLEIGPIAGELLEDGSIDFRERKIMVPVSAGQLIAVKVLATRGTPGETVLGEHVAQRIGLDMNVRTSDDAVYSAEKQQVLATCDGVLSVVQESIIRVCSKQDIPGDINYATGNVESRNSVVIHGSVYPGFQVKTGGDLEIRGSVMSTQVSSLSNIVIKGGIVGNANSVTASGDVDINFIEQGHIRCGGNCVIRKQSYYSYISSGGSTRCKEHSAIVGGELISEGSVTLGDAGASGADPAFIAAGVVAARLYQSRKLQERLKDYKESIVQRLKGYTGVVRNKKLRSFKGRIETMKLQSLKVNMIPGTGLYSRPIEDNDTEKPAAPTIASKDRRDAASMDINNIFIDIYGTIFAGTILQIGNRILTVERTTTKRRFKLDDSKAHIYEMSLP